MATKAELEAELADLRRQLAERPAAGPAPETDAEAETSDSSWDTEISDILKMLEDVPNKQPLLLALGAFGLGYLLGRSK